MKTRLLGFLRRILPQEIKSIIRKLYKQIRYSHTRFGNVYDTQTRLVETYNFKILTYKWDSFLNTPIDLYGVYDPVNSQIVWENIGENSTFVDIGAHTGWFSLLALKKGAKQVLAFEPNPIFFKLLAENLKDYDNALAFPVALGDKDRIVELYIAGPENTGNTSLSRENVKKIQRVIGKIRVPLMRLDTVMEVFAYDILKPDNLFLKIDVEGAEPLVLRGATKVLESTKNFKILLEFVPWKIEKLGIDPWKFLKELSEMKEFAKALIVAPDIFKEDTKEVKAIKLYRSVKELYTKTRNKKEFKIDLFLSTI